MNELPDDCAGKSCTDNGAIGDVSANEIAQSLTEAQREAIRNARWLSSSPDHLVLVDVVPPWPFGIAQFFTLKQDRLTDLGLAVRAIIERDSNGK